MLVWVTNFCLQLWLKFGYVLCYGIRAQVVGWPPIRSFRKNTLATKKNDDEGRTGSSCLYVKVSMDGAPYLRKVDIKTYSNYAALSSALEKMFSCFSIGLVSPFTCRQCSICLSFSETRLCIFRKAEFQIHYLTQIYPEASRRTVQSLNKQR